MCIFCEIGSGKFGKPLAFNVYGSWKDAVAGGYPIPACVVPRGMDVWCLVMTEATFSICTPADKSGQTFKRLLDSGFCVMQFGDLEKSA